MPLDPPPGSAAARALLSVGLFALVALIGMVDYWTGTELAFSIFFLIPIALAAWFVGPRTSGALAGASSVAWFLADRYGGFPYSTPTIAYWNAAVGLGFFLIIAATLSARRRTERRIVELMNVKSEFTSMVSHELRTPLTCIKEGIAIVLDGSPGPLNEAQQAHLSTAKRNVDRLARLLDDVLAFQKLEARRVELVLAPCDLGALVRQAVADFALAAERRGLALVLEVDEALPRVRCDADRVRQALDNLLGNALKFGARGPIRVRVERVPDGVRVAVQDRGLGIRAEDLPKLFHGFSQLATEASKREGTGLGLAIVRQIVELHGGRVGVESAPGTGSTFHFTLPPAPHSGRPAEISAETSSSTRGRAKPRGAAR